MQQFEEDSNHIKREIVPAYSQSLSLPGATVLPANAGQFGGQRGVKLDDPIAVVINPDDAVNKIELKTTDIAKWMPQALREAQGDSLAAYRLVAEWVKTGKVFVKPQEVSQQPQDPRSSAEGIQTAPPANKQATSKPGKPTRAPAPKSQPHFEGDRPVDFKKLGGAQKSDGLDLASLMNSPELTSMIQAILNSAVTEDPACQPSTPVRKRTKPVQVLEDEPVEDKDTINGMPIPRVQVTIESRDGSKWQCTYHEVLAQGDQLILIYDSRFIFGSRVSPPVNYTRAYKITVAPKEAKPEVFTALYIGSAFTHGNNEYQVLTVGPGEDDLADAEARRQLTTAPQPEFTNDFQ